ncbi:MAG: hypothetical protein FDX30_08430 [Chlorobium sp.]|nr:MAG: hypothetical protein FDX30_08430 [Chlorobium sp.]
MDNVKPYRIIIEWNGKEDFYFECDYSHCEIQNQKNKSNVDVSGIFPCMTNAMGNVLRKLRKEHISFPVFLVSLAFNHRNLLHEVDQLLHLLYTHLENKESEGTFSCYVSSKCREE